MSGYGVQSGIAGGGPIGGGGGRHSDKVNKFKSQVRSPVCKSALQGQPAGPLWTATAFGLVNKRGPSTNAVWGDISPEELRLLGRRMAQQGQGAQYPAQAAALEKERKQHLEQVIRQVQANPTCVFTGTSMGAACTKLPTSQRQAMRAAIGAVVDSGGQGGAGHAAVGQGGIGQGGIGQGGIGQGGIGQGGIGQGGIGQGGIGQGGIGQGGIGQVGIGQGGMPGIGQGSMIGMSQGAAAGLPSSRQSRRAEPPPTPPPPPSASQVDSAWKAVPEEARARLQAESWVLDDTFPDVPPPE